MPKKSTPTWSARTPFFDDVADRLGVRQRAAVVVVGDVAEGVEPEDERELVRPRKLYVG